MDIAGRISKIKSYFKAMQADANVIYVVVVFPENWKVYNDVESKFNVQVRAGNESGEYYFFANLEDGFDTIFDAIEYNIRQMKEGIERAKLLGERVQELKELFSNREISISSLRTLKFTYSEDIIEPEELVPDEQDTVPEPEWKNKNQKKGK